MNPSRKIPCNMKNLSTKMLQTQRKMKGSNSKMLQIQLQWQLPIPKCIKMLQIAKNGQKKNRSKKTKRKNHNSQNNSGPSINQALFHGMGKQSIFHPLHLNQEPPGTQPPPPTTPAPPMSVSRADGAVGTEGNTRNHLCN